MTGTTWNRGPLWSQGSGNSNFNLYRTQRMACGTMFSGED